VQHIATYLKTDQDVRRLSLACRLTAEAINDSVYYKRFLRAFDPISNVPNDKIVTISAGAYRLRRTIQKTWVTIGPGGHAKQQRMLVQMLKDIIIRKQYHRRLYSQFESHFDKIQNPTPG
jgi:hypothetical protein